MLNIFIHSFIEDNVWSGVLILNIGNGKYFLLNFTLTPLYTTLHSSKNLKHVQNVVTYDAILTQFDLLVIYRCF